MDKERINLTSITLTVTGAKATASVSGPLTSGMVGIPVTIEYDDSWNGLTKNLVCRCGQWGSDRGDTRTVLNVGETATVAHEVMKADTYLYLGIEGLSADGKLVIPTTWAKCGKIQYGANAAADPSATPKLSIWNQLQTEIRMIKQQTVSDEKIMAVVQKYLEENPIDVPANSEGGLLESEKKLMLALFQRIEYTTDVSAIITELENLWGGDSSGGESGGDTGGADTEALYPLTNASHVFDNSLIATVSDGNHVSLSAPSAITATANNATLYVNLSSLSQNGTATNSGNVSLGTTELFTFPVGSEVVLTLKNIVSNGVTLGANGYSVALRDASKTYLKIQNATAFTEQTASKTPEANATIYNVFLFFCGTFEEGATISFDIELTVDGERWI